MRGFGIVMVAWLAACGGESPAAKPAEVKEVSKAETHAQTAPAAAPTAAPAAADAAPKTGPLYNPAEAKLTAPAKYTVKFETAKGDILVDITREWAPIGADRLYSLVKAGFYDDVGFFRVVPGFVVQFGLNGDPAANKAWKDEKLQDDPVTQSNKRGTITFATSGPNTRTTQLFINFADNTNLDKMGFAPFGTVQDMKAVDAINAEYGQSPNQGRITTQGNAYLKEAFPKMDFITKATIIE